MLFEHVAIVKFVLSRFPSFKQTAMLEIFACLFCIYPKVFFCTIAIPRRELSVTLLVLLGYHMLYSFGNMALKQAAA